jgi:diguanylate cyclase (GGDEF)-like protein
MRAIEVGRFGYKQRSTRSLGTAIRWRRLAIGISQEQLAARMSSMGDHVRQSDISRLELDRISRPGQRRLDAIAFALDWTTAELREQAGYSVDTQAEVEGILRFPTFQKKLEIEIRRAQKNCQPLVLLLIRVLRHEAMIARSSRQNDEVLRQIAESLCAGLREPDIVAQSAQSEFAVLLPETPPSIAVRVRDRLEHLLPLAVNDAAIHLTISIALSSYPEDGETADELLRSGVIAAFARERQLTRGEERQNDREPIGATVLRHPSHAIE